MMKLLSAFWKYILLHIFIYSGAKLFDAVIVHGNNENDDELLGVTFYHSWAREKLRWFDNGQL